MKDTLLGGLLGALMRAPDHRAPTQARLREVSDAEIDAALDAALPPCSDEACTDDSCGCGAERLRYRPQRRSV